MGILIKCDTAMHIYNYSHVGVSYGPEFVSWVRATNNGKCEVKYTYLSDPVRVLDIFNRYTYHTHC